MAVTEGTTNWPQDNQGRFGVGVYDGAVLYLPHALSAANLSAAQSGKGGLAVAGPGEWGVNHAAPANTQATASKAAGGAGVRHVCRSITLTFASGGTAPAAIALNAYLRDGATGAGALLWAALLALPATAGGFSSVCLSDLNIVGSANTAMTLEFASAGGGNTFQTAAMSGYSVA